MNSKYNYCREFLTQRNCLACPICLQELSLNDHSLKCVNAHTFNVSKKGTSSLLATGYLKMSKMYNYELFFNRRKFINCLFYQPLYQYIANYLNKNFGHLEKVNILDLGCGEGTHSKYILDLLSFEYIYYGVDYSKVAIEMASDYNYSNRFYFVGDVNRLPIKPNSIDIVLDIVSPFNEKEVKRVLKNNGLFIKVVPNIYYLRELRESINMPLYSNADAVEHNLITKFNIIDKYSLKYNLPITKEEYVFLFNMTPIKNKINYHGISNITIDLIIYFMEGNNVI